MATRGLLGGGLASVLLGVVLAAGAVGASSTTAYEGPRGEAAGATRTEPAARSPLRVPSRAEVRGMLAWSRTTEFHRRDGYVFEACVHGRRPEYGVLRYAVPSPDGDLPEGAVLRRGRDDRWRYVTGGSGWPGGPILKALEAKKCRSKRLHLTSAGTAASRPPAIHLPGDGASSKPTYERRALVRPRGFEFIFGDGSVYARRLKWRGWGTAKAVARGRVGVYCHGDYTQPFPKCLRDGSVTLTGLRVRSCPDGIKVRVYTVMTLRGAVRGYDDKRDKPATERIAISRGAVCIDGSSPRAAAAPLVVSLRGVGPLRLFESTEAQVRALIGPPQRIRMGKGSFGPRFRSLGYGCDSRSCITSFDVHAQTRKLLGFQTVSRRYRTVHGAHVGMSRRQARKREPRLRFAPCGNDLRIHDRKATLVLSLNARRQVGAIAVYGGDLGSVYDVCF